MTMTKRSGFFLFIFLVILSFGACWFDIYNDNNFLKEYLVSDATIYERGGKNGVLIKYRYEINGISYKATEQIGVITNTKWVGMTLKVKYSIKDPRIHVLVLGDLEKYFSKSVCGCANKARVIEK